MSQFTIDECSTNVYADESMIYASGDIILEVKENYKTV